MLIWWWPALGALALAQLIGVYALIAGSVLAAAAWRARREGGAFREQRAPRGQSVHV
ncbi:hypothetical protein [Streptomyces sp. NPDC003015]